MMKTIKRKIKPWKILVTASVIPVVIFLVACQDQVLVENSTLAKIDQPAMPEGGVGSFYEHVAKKIKYPNEAREKGIVGKLLVEFVVGTDGTIDVTGISGIGGGCDLEAMLAVQTAPKWKPATSNGVAVQQRMVLPIAFKMDDPSLEDEMKKNDIQSPPGAMSEVVVVAFRRL